MNVFYSPAVNNIFRNISIFVFKLLMSNDSKFGTY